MSADATGYVYRHSPHTGATFQVHHAIADSVNDQHGNELWMATGTIATKARVARQTASEALATLVDSGCLAVVEDHRHDRAGKPSRYRFLFPDLAVVYETRGVTTDDTPKVAGVSPLTTRGVTSDDEGVTTDDTNPNNPKEPKEEAPDGAPPATADGMPLGSEPGHTYAETLAAWLGSQDYELPPAEQRDDSYKALMQAVDGHLTKNHPARLGVFIGLVANYVEDVCGEPFHSDGRGHLARLINTYGPRWTLWAMCEAVTRGAGISGEYAGDTRALTKYATAVLREQFKKAS